MPAPASSASHPPANIHATDSLERGDLKEALHSDTRASEHGLYETESVTEGGSASGIADEKEAEETAREQQMRASKILALEPALANDMRSFLALAVHAFSCGMSLHATFSTMSE